MCGLAGFTGHDPELAGRMLLKIAHRGPDGVGINVVGDYTIGHCRLAINGGDQAVQPMVKGEWTWAINGELYDYHHLRGVLRTYGYEFETTSDSELLGPLLDMPSPMGKLRGEFAFVAYNGEKEELYLTRDRFGIKPLFYAELKDGIAWASEIKALGPVMPLSLDREMCAHQMMHVMPPGRTAFNNVRSVKPGETIVVKHGKIIKRLRYWDLQEWMRDRHDSIPDAIVTCTDLLVEAVQLRMRADIPVGCYLSAGIDSQIAWEFADRPKAWTIAFPGSEFDEAVDTPPEAERIPMTQDDLMLVLAQEVYHSERTVYNLLGSAKLRLAQAAHDGGYKAVISGQGADELFLGYLHFSGRKDERFNGTMYADAVPHGWKGPVPMFLRVWAQVWDRVRKFWWAPSYEPFEVLYDELPACYLVDPIKRAQFYWINTMLEGQLLTWGGDRPEMAHSIEGRVPFLDHVLAEYALGIPSRNNLRCHEEKYILREIGRSLVPRRPKQAFMAPEAPLLSMLSGSKTPPFFRDRPWRQFLIEASNETVPHLRRRNDIIMLHAHCLNLLGEGL